MIRLTAGERREGQDDAAGAIIALTGTCGRNENASADCLELRIEREC